MIKSTLLRSSILIVCLTRREEREERSGAALTLRRIYAIGLVLPATPSIALATGGLVRRSLVRRRTLPRRSPALVEGRRRTLPIYRLCRARHISFNTEPLLTEGFWDVVIRNPVVYEYTSEF